MSTKTTLNMGLNKAGQAKKDEFYTQLIDIEKELKHYKEQFRGKVVYCNCDDPLIIAIIAGLVLSGALIEFKRHHKGIWLAGAVLIFVASAFSSLVLRFGEGVIN